MSSSFDEIASFVERMRALGAVSVTAGGVAVSFAGPPVEDPGVLWKTLDQLDPVERENLLHASSG